MLFEGVTETGGKARGFVMGPKIITRIVSEVRPCTSLALRVVIAAFLFFAFGSTAQAQLGLNQERISESKWRRGFHGFNMLAQGNELEHITFEEFKASDHKDILVVVFGRLKNLQAMIVTNHVSNGGSALVASDSSRPFSKSIAGYRFGKLSNYDTEESNAFQGMEDCPIVDDIRLHPSLSGVNKIVTNRPGYIWTSRHETFAWLPVNYQLGKTSGRFIGANENRIGGRMIAVGDQSIFTNQMILHGDNDLFANRAVEWLKNDRLKRILVFVDGNEYPNVDPTSVIVDVPPPSAEEVMDAIEDIPPSAMLDFANSVATVVEDENMVNDFLHDTVDKVPDSAVNRFYIYVLFGIACFSFLAAFLFQRKLQSQTASDVAYRRSRGQQVDLKTVQFHERQRAAHYLLDKFCFDVGNTRFADWPNFPSGLFDAEDRDSKNTFESMTKMSVLYRSKPTSFWTRKKLASLEREVSHWRMFLESRPSLTKS